MAGRTLRTAVAIAAPCRGPRSLVSAIGAVDAARMPFGELSHPRPEAPMTGVLRLPTYASIAGLPLLIERCELRPLVRDITSGFTKISTVVRLSGGSHVGEGEDITWDQVDQIELLRGGGDFHWLHGERTLDDFGSLLGQVNLFPKQPIRESARNYRRWAFESAALDLALRQNGLSLERGRRPPGPPVELRRVDPPRGPAEPAGTPRVAAAEPRACGSSSTRHRAGTTASSPNSRPWAASTSSTSRAPTGTSASRWSPSLASTGASSRGSPTRGSKIRRPHPPSKTCSSATRDRISWDEPIHSIADVERLPRRPRMLNVKPARFDSLRALLDTYDYCEAHGIGVYGGGMFEQGPGRGQLQYLASLFHPDGPNDIAPPDYNLQAPPINLPRAPLAPDQAPIGFRWGTYDRRRSVREPFRARRPVRTTHGLPAHPPADRRHQRLHPVPPDPPHEPRPRRGEPHAAARGGHRRGAGLRPHRDRGGRGLPRAPCRSA